MSFYEQALKEADETLVLGTGRGGRAIALPLRLIPACRQGFWMGSRGEQEWEAGVEQPRHQVVLTESFYMGSFPVTQAQFGQFRPEHESHFNGRLLNPVEEVSWEDAVEFCQWLTREKAEFLSQYDTERGKARFDLPTEAQWEYACRAGTDTEYWSGDGEAALEEVGWFGGNSDETAKPVCEKRGNEFKLYDMHGNVWEWCRDGWDEAAYRKRPAVCVDPIVNPDECKDRSHRVLRGGSWDASATPCRSAFRNGSRAGDRGRDDGFRLCLFPGPPSQPGPSRRSESYGGLKAEAERGAGRRRDAGAKAARNAAAADPLAEAHGPEISKR